MAITLDQNLGGSTLNTSSTTITHTTTATAAAGSRVVALVKHWHATTAFSALSGGGLTWVSDVVRGTSENQVAICSADAPSGLASGTVLTATFTAATAGKYLAAVSFLSVQGGTSGYVDVSGGSDSASGTAWTSGNVSPAGSSVLVAIGGSDGAAATNTPTSPSLELHDLNIAADFSSMASEYRIEPSGGTYAVAGTWSVSQSAGSTAAIVAYKEFSTPPPPATVVQQFAMRGSRW